MLPVVLEKSDLDPLAVFKEPVVFEKSELIPIAVLTDPVVLFFKALVPSAKLSVLLEFVFPCKPLGVIRIEPSVAEMVDI